MWFALERTRWGYEIRLIGDSPRAARYAGINIGRKIIVVFVISGGLAGLGGMSEVAGVVHRLQDRISPGYGFTAIIIAYLARFKPFRVVVASILFGALILAGREIQPSGMPAMIQGVILFSLIGSDVLVRYRVRFDRPRWRPPDGPDHHPGGGRRHGTILLVCRHRRDLRRAAGVLNLGVEGMMLIGAVAGFSIAAATGNPWLGLLVAMSPAACWPAPRDRDHPLPGRPDRVRARPDVPRDGSRPRARRGSVERRPGRVLPRADRPLLSGSRSSARSSSPTRACSYTSATCSCRSPGSGSTGPARGCTCARSARTRRPPTPGDQRLPRALRLRLRRRGAGRAGRRDHHAGHHPRLVPDQTTSGRGWIAVGLVIFAQWSPLRAAFGAFLFGAIRRFMLDVQGVTRSSASPTRSRPAARRRSSWTCCRTCWSSGRGHRVARGGPQAGGAPAALGSPYVRGERGA